jgi:hypothetical protein
MELEFPIKNQKPSVRNWGKSTIRKSIRPNSRFEMSFYDYDYDSELLLEFELQ